MRIDSHLHLWSPARGDYGWLTPDLPICREITLDEASRTATGIDAVILVQAAPTEAETRFLLGIAARAGGFVRAVVGWADLAAADAPARIAALACEPRLAGLRPMLQDIADPDWILRPEIEPALAAMERAGLVLDLLVRPAHLPRCRELARRHPGLAMVLDHAAKPAIAQRGHAAWAEALHRLAADTAIACKLSGLITEAAPGAGFEALAPYVRTVFDAFGPNRILWGSDWPVLTLAASYDGWRGAAEALTGMMAPDAVDAVFGGNAARIYRG